MNFVKPVCWCHDCGTNTRCLLSFLVFAYTLYTTTCHGSFRAASSAVVVVWLWAFGAENSMLPFYHAHYLAYDFQWRRLPHLCTVYIVLSWWYTVFNFSTSGLYVLLPTGATLCLRSDLVMSKCYKMDEPKS